MNDVLSTYRSQSVKRIIAMVMDVLEIAFNLVDTAETIVIIVKEYNSDALLINTVTAW